MGNAATMNKSDTRFAFLSIVCLAMSLAIAPALAEEATPNDTARVLAGLRPAPGSPLEPFSKDKAFAQYAGQFDSAWASFDARQLSKVKAWSADHLTKPQPAVFYLFSGPDFLYANAFFPKAETYILAGLEYPGEIPNIAELSKSSVPHELSALRGSLSSVFSYSFFKTREMRLTLYRHHLTGTIPVLYVFLARSGKTIKSVNMVSLDKDGALQPADRADEHEQEGLPNAAKGVAITFTGDDNRLRTLYYFRTDLSNDGVAKSGFLRFCASFGFGDSLLKSASYLPHSRNFSEVRDFLLTRSAAILQDDTGVPLKDFDANDWAVKPFGHYVRPISIFPGAYQPAMQRLFATEHARPLPFSIGYRWRDRNSSMILAERKPAGHEQASSDTHPQAVAQLSDRR
jgi:hypothetical protein